jgi:ABC-2 type transport system permease protein
MSSVARIAVIVDKELREVFRNRSILFTTLLLPVLFNVLAFGQLSAMRSLPEQSGDKLQGRFTELCASLSTRSCTQLVLGQTFQLLFMMLPIVIPAMIAAYSVVGEKAGRTLEPLLATPLRTGELLGGKMLAAVGPGLCAQYAGYGVFVVGLHRVLPPEVLALVFAPRWLLLVLAGGPLLAIMSVLVGLMVSSRVQDPRAAQQLSMLVVLPLVGFVVGQAVGAVTLSAGLAVAVCVFVGVLDVLLAFAAVQLFDRETILTRWK